MACVELYGDTEAYTTAAAPGPFQRRVRCHANGGGTVRCTTSGHGRTSAILASTAFPHTMDELRAISTFIRAAELGSFNRAAAAQGTTPQAVSKNVRQLEQYLGVRLFHRTTRKSTLTE